MVVKMVSWNVNKRALWDQLKDDPTVDVGLLQEAPRPGTDDVVSAVPASDHPWQTRGWQRELRTCICQLSDRVSLEPRLLKDAHEEGDALGVSRKGTVTVADVLRGDKRLFTAASIYGAWESPSASDEYIYADASVHRVLSDLSPLITGRPRVDVPIVVAGDLNVMFGYSEYNNAYWAGRYAAVFARAEAMGLRMVGPQYPNGRRPVAHDEIPSDSLNVPTFHHSRQTPTTATRQLDFVFASVSIADRVHVRAMNEPEDWGESDHCRIEITVDL